MKIKFFDKMHKKINTDIVVPIVGGILAATLMAVPMFLIMDEMDREKEILETPYIIENNGSYKLKDIYVLYKEDEIILCRRTQEIKSAKRRINISVYRLMGIPISSYSYEYIYKFYDIRTNEMVAVWDTETSEKKEMNGYEFINLGIPLKEDAIEEDAKVNQEYIDDYIKNKRFLEYIDDYIENEKLKR